MMIRLQYNKWNNESQETQSAATQSEVGSSSKHSGAGLFTNYVNVFIFSSFRIGPQSAVEDVSN